MSSGTLFVEPVVIADGGALTASNVDDSLDPPVYNAGVTYGEGFQVTSGASIYQSVASTNTGHPVDDTAWWVRVGAINRLRMFDRRIGAQTENDDTIEVEITPVSVIDVISVRNTNALSVTVQQSTVENGVVFEKAINLDEPVADWYEYFFSPITLQTEAVFTGLKPYTDATYAVTIDNTGGVAKCGELLMGPAFDAGITEAGVQDGIDDFSRIQPDEFGVRDIVERDYVENMEFNVFVDVTRSPALKRFLTQNRATPILVIASDARPDAQVYGLAESWRRTLSYPDMDVFSITMKGLT